MITKQTAKLAMRAVLDILQDLLPFVGIFLLVGVLSIVAVALAQASLVYPVVRTAIFCVFAAIFIISGLLTLKEYVAKRMNEISKREAADK